MPRQSKKNPRFRCNYCKEYHSAPEHMTMYQCASHGYLCEKCVVTENSTIELDFYPNKSNNRTAKFPEKYLGYCNLDGNRDFKEIAYSYAFFDTDLERAGLNSTSKDEQLIDLYRSKKDFLNKPNTTYGCKKTIRYDWDIENNLWVEDGSIPKSSNNQTAKSTHILLLIELFENNSISKEKFLDTIKAQLK